MSSEKTAAEFQLEKEMKRIQEVQVWLQLSNLLMQITVHMPAFYGSVICFSIPLLVAYTDSMFAQTDRSRAQ